MLLGWKPIDPQSGNLYVSHFQFLKSISALESSKATEDAEQRVYNYSHPMGFGAACIAILPRHLDHVAELLENEVELRFMEIAVPTFFDISEILL